MSFLGSHAAYWRQYLGRYEHWRFEEGFLQGWDDAYLFFAQNMGSAVVELGFKDQWARRRITAYVRERGSSQNLWEFGDRKFDSGNCVVMLTIS